MKKLLLIIALMLGLGLKAQCPLNTAVDFTATDVHGTEIHLFDILDQGQYVLIDFFFTTCGACIQTIPNMVESYSLFGCNLHDVFYLEIDSGDSEAACLNWVNNHNVAYPTISGAAGGTGICNQYGIDAFPTVILIAPNRSIVIKDLWPINSTQDIINRLEAKGVEQHDCNEPAYNPQVTINIDQVMETEITVTFIPNNDCISYAYTIATETEIQEWMNLAGLELPEYLWNYGIPSSGTLSNTFTNLTPNIEYIIFAVPADIEGNLGDVVQETVITTPGGNEDIIPDFTGTDIEGNMIHLYDILDAGQAVLINFFLTEDEFSEAIMPDITQAYRLFGCNTKDIFFMEITPNGVDQVAQNWVETYGVEYPTISRTGGGNSIAQSIPVGFYPTVMLIRPNHTIASRDIYPPTLDNFVGTMENEGYIQYPCYEETLTFDVDTLWMNQNSETLTIFNNTVEPVIHLNKITINDETPWFAFTFNNQDIYLGEEIDIPINQGQSIQLEVWFNIWAKEMKYPVLSFENTLETVSLVTAFQWTEEIQERESSVAIFPNPANQSVTLKGENLGTVNVFNTLGQEIEAFHTNGTELNINTANYESGVYVVKTENGDALRFVVSH